MPFDKKTQHNKRIIIVFFFARSPPMFEISLIVQPQLGLLGDWEGGGLGAKVRSRQPTTPIHRMRVLFPVVGLTGAPSTGGDDLAARPWGHGRPPAVAAVAIVFIEFADGGGGGCFVLICRYYCRFRRCCVFIIDFADDDDFGRLPGSWRILASLTPQGFSSGKR